MLRLSGSIRDTTDVRITAASGSGKTCCFRCRAEGSARFATKPGTLKPWSVLKVRTPHLMLPARVEKTELWRH